MGLDVAAPHLDLVAGHEKIDAVVANPRHDDLARE
jgi:hypothetical protein